MRRWNIYDEQGRAGRVKADTAAEAVTLAQVWFVGSLAVRAVPACRDCGEDVGEGELLCSACLSSELLSLEP